MPLITGECKKCQGRAIFNTGSLDRESVEAWLATSNFGECAAGGWHVEIGSMADYYALDWSRSFKTIEEAKEYNQAKIEEVKLNDESTIKKGGN